MSKYSKGRKQGSDDEVFQPTSAKKSAKSRISPPPEQDKPVTSMKNVNIAKLATFLAKELDIDKSGILDSIYAFVESTKPSKGEIIIVLGYSERSNGIFGDTEPIKEQLASLNVGNLKVTTPNKNLAFGSGFVSSVKYIDRVRELLATLDVNVREVQRSDYEVEYEGGEKVQSRAPAAKKITPAQAPAPKKTATSLKPPPPRPAKKIAKKTTPQDE